MPAMIIVRRFRWQVCLFVTKQEKDKCQDNAYKNARGYGKVESKSLAFNKKITRKTPQPGNFITGKQKKTDTGCDDTNYYEYFTKL